MNREIKYTPVENSTESKPKWVTPEYQNNKISSVKGVSLFNIINNEDMLNNFNKNEFPDIIETDDGKKWIDSVRRVLSTNGEKYVKWLLFDDNGKPVHDHNYPMTEIPNRGYLAKITVPIISNRPREFTIDYVININDINFSIEKTVNTLSGEYETRDVDTKYHIIQDDNNEVRKVLNTENFFDEYLYYMLPIEY